MRQLPAAILAWSVLTFFPGLIFAQQQESQLLIESRNDLADSTFIKGDHQSENEYQALPEAGLQDPEKILRRYSIQLNHELLTDGHIMAGDRVGLKIDSVHIELKVVRISSYTEGTLSILARSSAGSDHLPSDSSIQKIDSRDVQRQANHLSMTVQGDQVIGTLHLPDDDALYRIGYDQRLPASYIDLIDPEKTDILDCGVDHDFVVDQQKIERKRSELMDELDQRIGTKNLISSPETSKIQSGQTTFQDSTATIDLMIVYTPQARVWMEGQSSVAVVIAEALNRSQLAIDNSDVQVELRLVHTHQTEFDESGLTGREIYTELISPPGMPGQGQLDEVHILRNEYGVDLVALFAHISDVGGLAGLLNDPKGNSRIAFSVNRVQQMATSYTLVHELGHNMGNHHSRNQSQETAPESGGVFEYSTGWRWSGQSGGEYVSVMTYPQGGTRVAHFSNPDITYQGVPTGSYSGQYAPADNARSMNEIRHFISAYREPVVDPPGPPDHPELLAPADESQVPPEMFTLAWRPQDDATSYRVQLSADPNFQELIVNDHLADTVHRAIPALETQSRYYWRVRAKNRKGYSNWSEQWLLRTTVERPGIVEMVYPEDGAVQVPPDSALVWRRNDRADTYFLQISTSPFFITEEVVLNQEVSDTTYFPDGLLEPAADYYWRVRAINQAGPGDLGSTWSFTTLVDEPMVEPGYPNPFREQITFQYQLSQRKDVHVAVYDAAGRRVASLVDELQGPGVYHLRLDGSHYSSGVYFLEFRAGDLRETQSVTRIR